MRNKIIRTITLLFFVACISAFVGYRSGLADEFVDKGSSYTMFEPDTLPKKDSAEYRLFMPSSKSKVVPDDRSRSSRIRFDPNFKVDSILLLREVLGSSKSGVIIKPSVESDSVDEK